MALRPTTSPITAPGALSVMSLSRALRHKRRFDAVITLEDPACRPAARLRFHKKPAPAHLIMACEDVDDDTLGIQVATQSQVAEALAFARRHKDGALLVHCFHGVGRSAAIALAVLADRLGKGGEKAALAHLLEIRPEATPNLVIVKRADEILDREGRLVAVVEAWEAGDERVRESRKARRAFLLANPQLYARI